MSLCDTCRDPGHCCRRMWFSKGGDELTAWVDADPVQLLTEMIGEHWFEPIPGQGFEFTVPDTDTEGDAGRQYQSFVWRCTALGKDGRCTVYDRRPQLCRDYAAGSDKLCVMHNPEAPLEKAGA